ncbi:LuxR family transcriptional regulator [Ciceribacter sp. L1K23]|nr:LuxR family transcriptional regulator [Ciceribacter sp. L1K23]
MQESHLSHHVQRLSLTDIEVECLYQVAEGRRIDDIGASLTQDRMTAERHLANAQHKLGARNLLHAVSLALGLGIFDGKNG